MDRPPLHFGRRLAVKLGYEIKPLTYGGFPQQVRGKRDKMEECFRPALSQAADGTGTVALVLADDKLAVFVLIDAERARLPIVLTDKESHLLQRHTLVGAELL